MPDCKGTELSAAALTWNRILFTVPVLRLFPVKFILFNAVHGLFNPVTFVNKLLLTLNSARLVTDGNINPLTEVIEDESTFNEVITVGIVPVIPVILGSLIVMVWIESSCHIVIA